MVEETVVEMVEEVEAEMATTMTMLAKIKIKRRTLPLLLEL